MWIELIKWVVIGTFLFFLLPQIKALLDALAKFILNFGTKGKAQVKDIFSIDLSGSSSLSTGQQVGNEARYLELLKAYQSPTITNEEKYIKAKITETGCTNEQAINVLIADLANHRILFRMAFIDFSIYPEQIKLLFHLNVQAKPVSEVRLQGYLNEYIERTKDSAKIIDQFLGYLIDQRLITQNVDGYSVTIFGKEYLGFFVRMGRPVPKDESSEQQASASESTTK